VRRVPDLQPIRIRNWETIRAHSALLATPASKQLTLGHWPLEDTLRFGSYDEGGLSALVFAIFEAMKEALVDTLHGLEEFINPYGFASYFARGRVRGYGVA